MQVQEDRRNYPEFFEEWIQIERERLETRRKAKYVRETTTIRTKHELFSDSEDDEHVNESASAQKRLKTDPKLKMMAKVEATTAVEE